MGRWVGGGLVVWEVRRARPLVIFIGSPFWSVDFGRSILVGHFWVVIIGQSVSRLVGDWSVGR